MDRHSNTLVPRRRGRYFFSPHRRRFQYRSRAMRPDHPLQEQLYGVSIALQGSVLVWVSSERAMVSGDAA